MCVYVKNNIWAFMACFSLCLSYSLFLSHSYIMVSELEESHGEGISL